MSISAGGVLQRPDVSLADSEAIARECYGVVAVSRELGSNQDRNFELTESDGTRSVLRIDNPAVEEAVRDAQLAALGAYRAAGVPVPGMLPGLDGELTQRWRGLAVRRSEFAVGEPMVDLGYLAPVILEDFGALAAASVNALAGLTHPGLERAHMWQLQRAHTETVKLSRAIGDDTLRERVLAAAAESEAALRVVAESLPLQAIHGDLTDDNVTGVSGTDGRLHPATVLDLGDLAYGWRIAELAITVTALLQHGQHRPMRVLDAMAAFHRDAPISRSEAIALWPSVVLRACLLVASGHRQIELEADNDYARARTDGERAMFEAATRIPLAEATELVLARLNLPVVARDGDVIVPPAVAPVIAGPLAALLPDVVGDCHVLDLSIDSPLLDAGRWLSADTEQRLVARALEDSASVVLPYGVFRLTRTMINAADPAPTWPASTEIFLQPGGSITVTAPRSGTVTGCAGHRITIDHGDGWALTLDGVDPEVTTGTELVDGSPIGTVAESNDIRSLAVWLVRDDAPSRVSETRLVTPERVPAWARWTHDPAALLGLASCAEQDDSASELERRDRVFSSAQERFYQRPMQIERGWRHHLVDTTGRAYVDMVNNVTALGHAHPAVADAVNEQLRILGTNSRFLYRELADYSERLLAELPVDSGIDTVLLVNSGSEAVDLAIRLAQAATGRATVIALREGYHGWTMATDAVTTNSYGVGAPVGPRPEWVHVADNPNPYRGTYRGSDVASAYVADLQADVDRLADEGRQVAAFLCESVQGNAGGVLLPAGYLAGTYEAVRAAGGLCIADEVQVGFGRVGSAFWGFELSGVMPDLIAVAKPMGNGFPIGGVLTSRAIADSLGTDSMFFSSAGGNPVSCRAGIAVLDTMRKEGLQANAQAVGHRLTEGFAALAKRHPILGTIHGTGLYTVDKMLKTLTAAGRPAMPSVSNSSGTAPSSNRRAAKRPPSANDSESSA